jgi:hypothetical protein
LIKKGRKEERRKGRRAEEALDGSRGRRQQNVGRIRLLLGNYKLPEMIFTNK